ncbi:MULTISPECIES: hypothetical protein [Bacillus cereus group]|uniref:Uncharacterized protein n=1 Tax=Bacillus toyonensis TaxID=155322 RepID=A0A2B5BGV2_9BACI|nr:MULTISPECIES: hypothetical protein [Bacillus cereus group]OFD02299.1 hypothetical protein BTGOE7_52880 [Bacillus thuringiensis]MBJ8048073.1 hypothetical protein [Bacillus cereus group sp. N18]PEA64751.1 hypothetical protein COO18_21475 [Bacillus toyonensis]PEJ85743.1 hypothetical protein CN688_29930 [Bacillus toyonensis]PEK79185.1 hypothetical protein CN594_25595 [Bacillus toyonensis]
MFEQRKKRMFVIILLGIALTVDLTAKQLGYYTVAGVSVLFGIAVSLAWIVEIIRDKNKEEKQDDN